MTNTIQKKYKVSSTQLLYQSCPYQAITLFVTGPFLDGLLTNQNVFAFKYTSQVVVRMKQYMWNGLHYCFYIFTNTPCLNAVLHRLVLPHICFSKLQHVSRHWKDISCHLSGSRTSKNMGGVSESDSYRHNYEFDEELEQVRVNRRVVKQQTFS